MPFTPLHFGPGLLAKSLAPRQLSFTAFAAAQVVIDCESGYHLLVARDWPVHRLAHTFLLATPIGLLAGLLTWATLRRLGAASRIAVLRRDAGGRQCALGGLLGGATHPFLDGLIHRDIRPLAPFLSGNPFLGIVSRAELHVLCVAAGLLGLAILAARGVLSPHGAGVND
jgi:hypothetical protein